MTVGADGPGSAGEFADWVRPHWAAMAKLAARLGGREWEDALQEALADAWRKRAQYDAARGTPRAWLLAIVADKVRASWRARRPQPVAEVEELVRPGHVVDRDREARLDLARVLDRLTERQRLTVELYYYLGLSVAEVAAVLDCADGTVKSTLSDARRRLRQEIGEKYR